jgi:hypothetical protein
MVGVLVHCRTYTNMGIRIGHILRQAAEISRYVGLEPVNILRELSWDYSGSG